MYYNKLDKHKEIYIILLQYTIIKIRLTDSSAKLAIGGEYRRILARDCWLAAQFQEGEAISTLHVDSLWNFSANSRVALGEIRETCKRRQENSLISIGEASVL